MQIKPTKLRGFHKALASWYQAHGRHELPWRNTDDPYAIWVSEIMLQQTQVATVETKYYAPFLKQFPTIQSLAAAPRERVMKAWEGLGYYRRAGFLHDAAGKIGKGNMPDTLDGLLALPGIGRNTAHAILAFGCHKPYAVMEANVKRIVARVFAQKNAPDNALFDYAAELLNEGDAFDYNQAMMDLGATLCTPKAPHCGECPAATICQGKDTPEAYPEKKIKKAVPTKHPHIWVIENKKDELFLLKREAALLGGLYGFPQENAAPKGATKLGSVKHAYSHFKLDATVQHVRGDAPKYLHNQGAYYSREEIENLPLSKVDLKVLALLA